MSNRPVIVLTGGTAGGKSMLIDSLKQHPGWSKRFVALPEAVYFAWSTGLVPQDRLLQRVVMNFQISLEDALDRSLDPEDPRLILCHRGSLDPLAFWRMQGWAEEDFFEYTSTRLEEHYQRYTAVLHMVTNAVGVPLEHTRWPSLDNPEKAIEEARRLDALLHEAWRGHPRYYRLDNEGRNWAAKAKAAKEILAEWLGM
jgi:hypothetical protein